MNEPNKLDKDMYFSQPPDEHVRQEVVTVNDPDNIVGLSNKVHSPEISTGAVKKVVAEDIDKNLINNIPNETEVNKNPVESVKDILQEKPQSMTGGGACTNSSAGALSFNANSLPKTAGALAFNDEELIKQLSALKKNDRIGSGALATAAITSLISVAPQIIKAISDLKKGKTVGEGSAIYMKDLSPDKYDQMEALMKQIKNQKNNFKFDSANNEYVVGTGKFGDFMSRAFKKVKEIYGSESFKPIRNALLSAASNTATKAINKVADKAVSKVNNEDLKNIINVTRETAENAKNNIIDSQKASGCVKKGGKSANNAARYLSTQNKAEVFDKLANDELASDSCEEDELVDPKNIFKKKSMNIHPGLPNSKTIVGKYKKVRARSVFL
nr:hypothetical protein [uncultured Methanosphaera sp.]